MRDDRKRWEDRLWKPFEFIQAALHKGSRENLIVGFFFAILVFGMAAFGVGR